MRWSKTQRAAASTKSVSRAVLGPGSCPTLLPGSPVRRAIGIASCGGMGAPGCRPARPVMPSRFSPKLRDADPGDLRRVANRPIDPMAPRPRRRSERLRCSRRGRLGFDFHLCGGVRPGAVSGEQARGPAESMSGATPGRSRAARVPHRDQRLGLPAETFDRCGQHVSQGPVSPKGVPSESRQIAQRWPGWMISPPSSRTRSSVAARSVTGK